MGVQHQSVTSATQREAFKETMLKSTLSLEIFFPNMKHLFSDPFFEEITKSLVVRPHEVQGLGIARQLCEVILEQIGPVIHFLSGRIKLRSKLIPLLLHPFSLKGSGAAGLMT